MKLLTATRQGQGDEPGDFSFTTEGELVLLGFVCASDRANPDGGCGCGRAFSGLGSMRATTTALVRDLDISPADLRLAVEGYWTAAGLGPDVVGDDFADMVSETVEGLLRVDGALEAGTLVGRRLDHLVHR